MFAKNTLASAFTAAIGVSAVGLAQADAVFFPYVATSPAMTTIVSVVNTSANNWNQSGRAGDLHYRFYFKPLKNGPKAACNEYDAFLPTSMNDIQTIDLGGIFDSGTAGVLFSDPSINNKWQQSRRDYALGRSMSVYGYLIVDNSDTNPADETLTGEALVFDFTNGISWGYQAHSSTDGDFRAAASQSPLNVGIMPFNEVATSFVATPVSIDQNPDFANTYRARVELSASGRGDLYDRDENLLSGTIPQDVVCVGRIKATDLMTLATQARVSNGGWGKMLNYRVVSKDRNWVPAAFKANAASDSLDRPSLVPVADKNLASDGAVIIKLENSRAGTLNGKPVNKTYDSAMMLAPDKANPF